MGTILNSIPAEAQITRIEYEGPRIALYTKNPKYLHQNNYIISEIVNTVKKRVVTRTEKSIRKPEQDAKAILEKALPVEAGVSNYFFDDATGEVTVEANNPRVLSPDVGYDLGELMGQTGWKVKVRKAPHIASVRDPEHVLRPEDRERREGEVLQGARRDDLQAEVHHRGAGHDKVPGRGPGGRAGPASWSRPPRARSSWTPGISSRREEQLGRLPAARLGGRQPQRDRRRRPQPRPPRPHGVPAGALQVRLRRARLLHGAHAPPDDAPPERLHQDSPDGGRKDPLRPEGHPGPDTAHHHAPVRDGHRHLARHQARPQQRRATSSAPRRSTSTSARGSTTSSTRATTSTAGPSSSTRPAGTTRGSRRSSPRPPTATRRTSCLLAEEVEMNFVNAINSTLAERREGAHPDTRGGEGAGDNPRPRPLHEEQGPHRGARSSSKG